MPNKIPAFGLSAVPLPMKNRRMLPGCHPPIADAAGDATAAAEAAGPICDTAGSAGSPLEVVAAASAVPEPEPNSRRVTANAAHANGAAAGESPPEPEPNHDNSAEPIDFTDPRGVAVITGTSAGASSTAAAGAGAGATTDSTTGAGAEIGDASPVGTLDPPPADGPGTDAGAPLDSAETASEGEGAASGGVVSGVTRPPSEFLRRGTAVSAAPTGLWVRARGPAPSRAADSAASDPDSPPSADPRPPPARGPRVGEDLREDEEDDEEDDEESAEPDPLDPAEPVVSANAIGSEPRPEPTPRATANAPTRPTYRAKPDNPDSPTPTERRPYSIVRTPVVSRRPAACLGSITAGIVTPRADGKPK